MMLTGKEIARQVGLGHIVIEPFDEKRLNPNSYNLRLGPKLMTLAPPGGGGFIDSPEPWFDPLTMPRFDEDDPRWRPREQWLDMAKENKSHEVELPSTGLVLTPGTLYLATTIEKAGSDWFVPCVEGRSSVGRLGMQIHATAGFGDLGFKSHWTLEITVTHPLRIYAGVEIAQVIFTVPYQQETDDMPHHVVIEQFQEKKINPYQLYQGKYNGQTGPKPSGLWKEFKEGKYAAGKPSPSSKAQG